MSSSSTDAAVPDPTRRNPQPAPWDWIDFGPDDQTLRIEFLEDVVHSLHHIEIDEDDENIQVTVFVGVDPNFHGAAALVGFARWAMARPTVPWRVGQSATAPRSNWLQAKQAMYAAVAG